jgi:hypothetical protein
VFLLSSQPQAPEFQKRTNGFTSNLLSWGARAVSSNLCPTCCYLPVQVLCFSSSMLQFGQGPEGKWVEPGPSSAPPSALAPSAAAPSSSRPPGQPPPSLLPACPVLCLFSEKQTRDWGEGGGSQERKWHLTAPAPNLGGCRGGGEEQGGFSLCEGNFIFNRC